MNDSPPLPPAGSGSGQNAWDRGSRAELTTPVPLRGSRFSFVRRESVPGSAGRTQMTPVDQDSGAPSQPQPSPAPPETAPSVPSGGGKPCAEFHGARLFRVRRPESAPPLPARLPTPGTPIAAQQTDAT